MLMEILGFVGINPELWPFIAIAGGVTAIGYSGWKMFFDKPKDSTDTKIDSTVTITHHATTEEGIARETGYRPELEVTLQAPTALVPKPIGQPSKVSAAKQLVGKRAEAPEPAGAPVAMPTGDDKSIMAMIQRHEGLKQRPYQDTQRLWTIGVGHLIGDGKTLPPEWDREFSLEEIQTLFAQDYIKHKEAAKKIPGFSSLNSSGQAALIDITYNMGPTWWHKWPTFTKYMQAGDIPDASTSLQDSKWYTQVGGRAREDVALLKAGSDKTSSTTDTKVQQTAAVTITRHQQLASNTPTSNTSSSGSSGSTVAAASEKSYIKGPKGSIVAIS
jgi:lysozyme